MHIIWKKGKEWNPGPLYKKSRKRQNQKLKKSIVSHLLKKEVLRCH